MKILLCHNYYQQAGGEDQAFADKRWLLESQGHEVRELTVSNHTIGGMSRLDLAASTLWNRRSYRAVFDAVARYQVDVVDFMNTFPLLSPSAYYAARRAGAAVVQEVQNFRFFCAGAYFMRDGAVCEDCLGKQFAWPAIQHGCYRGSRTATAMVATLQASHRVTRTYQRAVDAFIAMTNFSRDKFIEGGLDAERIFVKPNFVTPDPGLESGSGGYAIFVGRLSPEKGIHTLLSAWQQLATPYPLKIVGDGPLTDLVRAASLDDPNLQWLGRRPLTEVLQLIGGASFLMLPSLWYEGLPKTLLESFAKGTPVIASDLGAMSEVVDNGRNGVRFSPGNAAELAGHAQRLLLERPRLEAMRRAARESYLSLYTPEVNYPQLMSVYSAALRRRHGVAYSADWLPQGMRQPHAEAVGAAKV